MSHHHTLRRLNLWPMTRIQAVVIVITPHMAISSSAQEKSLPAAPSGREWATLYKANGEGE